MGDGKILQHKIHAHRKPKHRRAHLPQRRWTQSPAHTSAQNAELVLHVTDSYFRAGFSLTPVQLEEVGAGRAVVALRMVVDDGAHVLMNGQSVLQHNLPSPASQAAALRAMAATKGTQSRQVDGPGPTLQYDLRARQAGSVFDKVGGS